MLTATLKSDAQLKHDVTEELRWEPLIDETSIRVRIEDGIVVLTGSVKTYAEKIAAEQAVHRVKGVLDLANDLEVKPMGMWKKSDHELAAAVRSSLEWHAMVPDKRIHSTVSNGWVTLTGEVEHWSQKEQAERAVRHLTGVKGVSNNIDVAGPVVTSETVRNSIHTALERRADRHADRMTIDVKDGIVTLRGKVHSWAEKRAVRAVAGAAAGVRAVCDHLEIDPFGCDCVAR